MSQMKCEEIEPLFTAYVDREAAARERSTVEAHLLACPPCRERVGAERAAREVLHARQAGLRPCASAALRTRCAAHAAAGAVRGGVVTRRAWVPLSLAAGVLLAVSATLFFAGSSAEVLAAQLAVDHVKCFQFTPDRGAVDPLHEAQKWEAGYGWPLTVPPSAAAQELELLGVRRCLSSEGRIAHLMYRWRGRPLSVFVLNSRVPHAGGAGAGFGERFEKLGEQAIIWSRGERTYAVVADASLPALQQLAVHVRTAME